MKKDILKPLVLLFMLPMYSVPAGEWHHNTQINSGWIDIREVDMTTEIYI